MRIDGICGPQTIAYIKNFQEYGKSKSARVIVDGKVHPRARTMFGLNAVYMYKFGDQRLLKVYQDPEFPASLQPKKGYSNPPAPESVGSSIPVLPLSDVEELSRSIREVGCIIASISYVA